jgi:predicted Rossmann fold nucleotide-binding protein DprA/Smf involved in DNA uptake
MIEHDAVSPDAQSVILLCSSIAAARGAEQRPFGPRGWAKLQGRISNRGMTPAELLGLEGPELAAALALGPEDTIKISRLLARSGQLAFELDRLAGRGIGAVTLMDDGYPSRLRSRLGADAPPVLFVSGDRTLLETGGIAIVGSREVDAAAVAFAGDAAAAAALGGETVVSGCARGVDQEAMRSAFEAGGCVLGVLPEGLERRIRDPETRAALAAGVATLVSPYHPGAGFTAGAAMARNKLIYALADVSIVVSSAAGSGGTWTGAVEALEAGWVPVFVRRGDAIPEGNRQLIERGGLPLDEAAVSSPITAADLIERAGPPVRRVAEATPAYEQQALPLDG